MLGNFRPFRQISFTNVAIHVSGIQEAGVRAGSLNTISVTNRILSQGVSYRDMYRIVS